MKFKPWPYQAYTIKHIVNNKAAGALLDMGLGKTVSTLSAIDLLINRDMEVGKVLVVAPKRVAETVWMQEAQKWDHLKHLSFSIIAGDQRSRKLALMQKADIYVIGIDNFAWLVGQYNMNFPFDMLVIDESSLFKNASSQRFKALRIIRPMICRVVILTGTPAPNGLIDLWSQLYILDRGERLGEVIQGYKDRFFVAEAIDGYRGYKYTPRPAAPPYPDGASMIYNLIGDICVSMKTEDYLDLPERIDNVISVDMGNEAKEAYKQFERDCVMELANETEITAVNASALSIKLTQFANGAVYDAEKKWHTTHDAKLDALEEIIDTAQGNPVLVFYWFKHDYERIMKRFPKARALKDGNAIDDWNAGKIQIALAHPASAGHGLNLQHGGNICVWFGLTWDLQLYQQANKRLHRQGQTKAVIVHHLVCPATMDVDIMRALRNKAAGQDELMSAIKARFNIYKIAA